MIIVVKKRYFLVCFIRKVDKGKYFLVLGKRRKFINFNLVLFGFFKLLVI